MAQMNFLDLVKNYDKDGLTAAQIKQIQPYTTNELFNPDKLKSLNMVAMNFCKWVLAMQGYYQVNLIVIPKRKELEIANAEYERVSKNLKIAQDKLAVVVREVNELTDNLNRLTSEKKELDDRVEDCKLKLERAEKLISGLGGEKTRWKAAS
jgi:dynein heavy chain, axonemal